MYVYGAFAQNFTLFSNPDGDNSLQALAIDEENDRIWVGTNATTTGETIAFFENGQWTELNAFDLELLSGRLEDLIVNQGIVEACSLGGVSRIDWDNQVFETWTSQNSDLTVDAVRALAKNVEDNILYVGTYNGVEMQTFDGSSWGELEDVRFPRTAAYDVSSETLWVGTAGNGLFKINDEEITNYEWNNSEIPSGNIYDLEIAPDGTVWMVIDDEGLISFDGTNWQQFTMDNSEMNNNNPDLVTIDNQGLIWIGGFEYGGIASFDGSNFTNYLNLESEIPTNNIRQMKTATNGDLWMATSIGLVRLSFIPNNTNEVVTLSFNSHPNPFTNQLVIEWSDRITEKLQIDILTVDGALKYHSTIEVGTSTLVIDANNWSAGQYFVRFKNEEGIQSTQRLVKINP